MNIHHMVTGSMSTNTYILFNQKGGESIIVDPAGSEQEIESFIQNENLSVNGILLTHGHVDHIRGVEILRQKFTAPVWIHAGDTAMLPNPEINLSAFLGESVEVAPADRVLADGDVIHLDETLLNVCHTPGHTPGGICLIGPGCVIAGDTLFAGNVGRTDLPGGDMHALMESIQKNLMVLADHILVFPGHGPQTSIGKERRYNPFLRGEEQ